MTVMPIGWRQLPSPVSDRDTGIMPATIATVVITIGWARLCPASMIASSLGTPWFIMSTAKSTSKIEFLATMPNSMSTPISTGNETAVPVSASAIPAPSGANSSEPMLTSGERKRRYSSTSTANTSSTPAPKAKAK